MPSYSVYGGCLQSAVTFAELSAAPDHTAPDWILDVTTSPEPSAGELLGTDRVNDEVDVHLHRVGDGFRLTYADTGTFDVAPGGRRITWRPGPTPDPENVQDDILGRVLATALHASGRFCLHASAIAFDPGALAFIAPKHHGKSTLALRAVARGARLLTDDSLPLDAHATSACPGVHGLRLWGDVLARWPDGAPATPLDKRLLSGLPEASLAREPVPLKAIYVLVPSNPAGGIAPARRERLPHVTATLQLVRHAKVGALLGRSEAPVLLERAAAVVRNVPVYALFLVRDLDALDLAVTQLEFWLSEDASHSLR